jgi:hypothetical protein
MSLREKLAVMEVLWEEISRQEQSLEVPDWHKELLDARQKMVTEGSARFIDWEEAKKQIKAATE